MVLLFSSTPSHADIKSFMDDAEREYWDTQQGTPEERVAFCKSLEDLWRTIPDPTEAELEQVMGPLDWGHVQRGENREDILGFYRRKWKKDRKAAAEAHKQNHQSSLPEPETKKRKGVRISDLIKASKDNPPAGDYKPGDASELFKKAEENPDASKPDLTSLNDSFRKLGERMQKDREESAQRLADSLRELVKPPTTSWGEFFPDPQTGRTSIRHDPIRDDEYPPPLVEWAEEENKRRQTEEAARLAGIERAVDNALKRAEDRARTPSQLEGFTRRMGFTPMGETPDKPHNRFVAWVKANPFWAAAVAFLIWQLPLGIAQLWPALVRDKTIPEWVAERRWPGMTAHVYGWLSVIFFVTLIILAMIITVSRKGEKTKGDES